MRVEQACRFRLDETGYGIAARSPGFDTNQEMALGKVFNDSMNSIFPKVGSSVLTCVSRDAYTFLARNTLRSDIHGRVTLFTHSYVLSKEEYARYMQENPALLLSIPMSRMVETQAPGVALEALELSEGQPMDLGQLMQKYNLTPDRYSRLLLGAYEAITSNGSLCLRTNLTLAESEQLVREIAYCILDGLLPVMKGALTFSSGPDTRMTISVLPSDCKDVVSSAFVFGVENDSLTTIRPRDEMVAQLFSKLGSADSASRKAMLQNMQNWLDQVVNVQDGLSMMLIAAAGSFANGQGMTQDSMIMLMRNFTNAAGKTISVSVADSLLTALLEKLMAMGACNSRVLSHAAQWYLNDSSEAFRSCADKAFMNAPVAVCTDLIEALFNLDMSDNVRQMLLVLLNRVSPDAPELSDELKDNIVRWILREDLQQLGQYGEALLAGYSDYQMHQLAGSILRDAMNRPLTQSEDTVLAKAVAKLAAGSAAALSAEQCDLLDRHIPEYSNGLTASAIEYYLRVRLAAGDVNHALALLDKTAGEYPQFFKYIKKALASGYPGTAEIWEHYQVRILLNDEMSIQDIFDVCQSYNTFNTPGGVFEMRAANLWLKCVKGHLISYRSDRTVKMEHLINVVSGYLTDLQQLNLSTSVREKMKNSAINLFWGELTYDQIIASDFQVPNMLWVRVPKAVAKMDVIEKCIHVMNQPENPQPFVDLICRGDRMGNEQKELQNMTHKLMYRVMSRKRFVSWDLLLLSCWQAEGTYDLDEFSQKAERLDRFIEKLGGANRVRMTAADSVLLKDAALQKSIIKLGAYEQAQALEDLIGELKAGKKSVMGGFMSGAKKPSDDFAQPAAGRFAHGADKGSKRGGNSFDPTYNPFEAPQEQESKGGFFGWKGKGNSKK